MVAKEGVQSPVLLHQKTREETNHKTKTKSNDKTRKHKTRSSQEKTRTRQETNQNKTRQWQEQDKIKLSHEKTQDKTRPAFVLFLHSVCRARIVPRDLARKAGTRQRPRGRGGVWIRIRVRGSDTRQDNTNTRDQRPKATDQRYSPKTSDHNVFPPQ